MRAKVEELNPLIPREAARELLWRDNKDKNNRPENSVLVGFYLECSDIPEPDHLIALFDIDPEKDFIHAYNDWPSIRIYARAEDSAAYPCILQLTPEKAGEVSALLEAYHSLRKPIEFEQRRKAMVSSGGALYTITPGRMNAYEFIQAPDCNPVLPRPTSKLSAEYVALLNAASG